MASRKASRPAAKERRGRAPARRRRRGTAPGTRGLQQVAARARGDERGQADAQGVVQGHAEPPAGGVDLRVHAGHRGGVQRTEGEGVQELRGHHDRERGASPYNARRTVTAATATVRMARMPNPADDPPREEDHRHLGERPERPDAADVGDPERIPEEQREERVVRRDAEPGEEEHGDHASRTGHRSRPRPARWRRGRGARARAREGRGTTGSAAAASVAGTASAANATRIEAGRPPDTHPVSWRTSDTAMKPRCPPRGSARTAARGRPGPVRTGRR